MNEVAHPRSGSWSTWFLVELEFENVGFCGDGKIQVGWGKSDKTNNKLNQHMAGTPGFETQAMWEVSAPTTSPPLSPLYRFWSWL